MCTKYETDQTWTHAREQQTGGHYQNLGDIPYPAALKFVIYVFISESHNWSFLTGLSRSTSLQLRRRECCWFFEDAVDVVDVWGDRDASWWIASTGQLLKCIGDVWHRYSLQSYLPADTGGPAHVQPTLADDMDRLYQSRLKQLLCIKSGLLIGWLGQFDSFAWHFLG